MNYKQILAAALELDADAKVALAQNVLHSLTDDEWRSTHHDDWLDRAACELGEQTS
jgi:hypothetical protein